MSLHGVFDDASDGRQTASATPTDFIGYEPNVNETDESDSNEDLLEGAERASGFEEDIGGFGGNGGPPIGSGDSDDLISRRSRASPSPARPGTAAGQSPPGLVPPTGGASPEFFDIGGSATAAPEGSHEMQLIMRLVKALELSRGSGSGETKFKLSKMPSATTERGLPSAKAWRQWYDVRLLTWVAACDADFEVELDQFVKGKKAHIDNTRANRQLAYELCTQVDDRMLLYLLSIPKTDGAGMLKMLYRTINKTTDERTAALHERFSRPVPCRVKEKLSLALHGWKEDLEELQAAGAAPSKETVAASLKILVGQVRELKGLCDLLELMHPNNPKQLFSVASAKRPSGR
jgi:hypothetical protein